ncbi:MAG TPA: biotin/lipoyl-containing protein, partial [Pyrinomonadaceae bacterium]
MATQVIMPKLSPTMEEGQLSRWLKKEGDKVSMGEPLAEIDTDKATMEMQALGDGVLRKILIQEGESAPLGQLIAIIGEPDEDISSIASQAPAGAAAKAPAP